MYLLTGIQEMDELILLTMDIDTLYHYCITCKIVNQHSVDFWIKKFKQDTKILRFWPTKLIDWITYYKYNHYDDIMCPTFESSYMYILNKIKYADQLIQDILLMTKSNHKFWQYQYIFITVKYPSDLTILMEHIKDDLEFEHYYFKQIMFKFDYEYCYMYLHEEVVPFTEELDDFENGFLVDDEERIYSACLSKERMHYLLLIIIAHDYYSDITDHNGVSFTNFNNDPASESRRDMFAFLKYLRNNNLLK